MKDMPGRGRVAKWGKEKFAALTTPELRQLLANAERLKETEVAAFCQELITERRKTGPRVPKPGAAPKAKAKKTPAVEPV